MILLIDNYDSFSYNLYQLIGSVEPDILVIRNDAATVDEVASMGGTFIHLDLDAADASGGYAKELGQDRAKLQRELLTPHVHEADVIITTAAIVAGAAATMKFQYWLLTREP